jgi:hypothetical protein
MWKMILPDASIVIVRATAWFIINLLIFYYFTGTDCK